MGDFLIVSLAEELQADEDLAQEYQDGFEINYFYDPVVFEDKKRREISEGRDSGRKHDAWGVL